MVMMEDARAALQVWYFHFLLVILPLWSFNPIGTVTSDFTILFCARARAHTHTHKIHLRI